MSLSAISAAENNPLINWSKSTLNNVLLQGDKMYLKALHDGLINLDPGVELLSVDNLPTLVTVSCNKNTFSYEICRSAVSPAVHAKKMATNSDLSFVVDSPEPEALKYIDLPIVAQNINIDLPIVALPFEAQNNIDQPIVVEPVEALKYIVHMPETLMECRILMAPL